MPDKLESEARKKITWHGSVAIGALRDALELIQSDDPGSNWLYANLNRAINAVKEIEKTIGGNKDETTGVPSPPRSGLR